MGKIYSKSEVIDFVWQYSRYYGNLLAYCEQIVETDNGHASLIYIFNLLENIFKANLNDYNSNFQTIIKKTKNKNFINETEYKFLDNKMIGIRRIRNLLAHANLAKFNIVFLDDNKNLLFPLTENETCQKLYSLFSDVLYNLILKVICPNFIIPINIDLTEKINNINYQIKEISAEEILIDKGVNFNNILDWNKISESDRYRLAENMQNVKVLAEILKQLK